LQLGVGVDTALTAAKCGHFVVAQINDNMPRTWRQLHSRVDIDL
jgi:hypothetical protein